jgi:hypothetical protein
MGMTDNKVLSWNITLKQWLGLAAIGLFSFVIVYTESLILGYVVATLALSAFFVVVAFDIGVPKARRLDEPLAPDEPVEQERKTA